MMGISFQTCVLDVTFIFPNYCMFKMHSAFFSYMGNAVITISVLTFIGFFQIIYLDHSPEIEL